MHSLVHVSMCEVLSPAGLGGVASGEQSWLVVGSSGETGVKILEIPVTVCHTRWPSGTRPCLLETQTTCVDTKGHLSFTSVRPPVVSIKAVCCCCAWSCVMFRVKALRVSPQC